MFSLRTVHKIAIARCGYRILHIIRGLAGQSDNVVATRGGIHWSLDLSQVIDFCIYALWGFEYRTLKLYKRLINPGDVVIDVGANIGAHTLPLAALVGSAGKVIAIEPTSYAFRKLSRNVALNENLAGRIELKQAMATRPHDKDVEPKIYSSWPLTSSSGVHDVHGGKLKSTAGAVAASLDDIVSECKLSRLDFIKIDVDGHENEVLAGAAKSIKKFKPLVVMELEPCLYLDNQEGFEEIFSLLREWKASITDVNTGKRLPPDATKMRNFIPTGTSRNVLVRFK